MLSPILFGLDAANQAAYAAGESVPNILGMAFNYITTTAVVYPAFAVAVLLFAKSQQMKTVGKIAVVPSFFGISEPMVYGLPVVYNPVMMIPWILIPAVNMIIGWLLMTVGIVPKCIGVTVFNIPMIFTGIVNGSFMISIMEVLLFALDIALCMPFIKAADLTHLKEEKAAAASPEDS